jgi:alpha-N-arabinofuranosidase
MSTTTVTVDTTSEIGIIRPELHGHFLEHLGTAMYGGMWVGKDSPIPNINGFRKAAVEYLRELDIPVLRWPGGCYADDYHWRDGIGPPEQRPRRVNLWWGFSTESGSAGTHEFVGLCRMLGAQPYLAGNVGSGSPQELRDWMEYCNHPSGSTLSDERIANGAPEPFGVRYWGIGNESWACGGHMTPEEYGTRYVRFVTFLRAFGGTEPVFFAVGPEGNDTAWTRRFLETLNTGRRHRVPVHAIAMHYYCWGDSRDVEYTPETVRTQLAGFDDMERAIREHSAILDSFPIDPAAARTLLAVDEWGTWDKSNEAVEESHGKFWQQGTMKDGVAAGLALNVFHRQADRLMMCNLAQLANVLQAPILTYGSACLRTPTFYSLRLCKPHRGKTSLPVENPIREAPGLSVSASRDDTSLVLTLVNPDQTRQSETLVRLTRGLPTDLRAEILHHADWNACNTFEHPDTVVPRALPVTGGAGAIRLTLPPLSVATVTATLRE